MDAFGAEMRFDGRLCTCTHRSSRLRGPGGGGGQWFVSFRIHLVYCFAVPYGRADLNCSLLSIGTCKAQNKLMIHDGSIFSSHDSARASYDLCLLVEWNNEGFLVFDHVACALKQK